MQFLARLLELAWAGINSVPRVIASANVWLLVPLLIAAIFWVGAASWAATLAEKRKQSPIRHFLLGLLVPFVYPFMLAAESGRGGAAVVAAKPAPVPAAPVPMPTLAPVPAAPAAGTDTDTGTGTGTGTPAASAPAPTAVGAVPAAAEDLGFGPEYFRRLQKAGVMTLATPCVVHFGGREITASAILEIQPEVVVLEVRAADGKPQRIRVPYARIEDVTK